MDPTGWCSIQCPHLSYLTFIQTGGDLGSHDSGEADPIAASRADPVPSKIIMACTFLWRLDLEMGI